MKITCDTDISELIKISDVDREFSELSDDIKPILVYSKVLKKESVHGRGLSREGLSIEGISKLNSKTIDQINSLDDFYSHYSGAKSSLIDAVLKQRKKELKELETAVENKIAELNTLIANINNIPETTRPPLTSINKVIDSVSKRSIYQTDLKKYKKKLQVVKAELGRV